MYEVKVRFTPPDGLEVAYDQDRPGLALALLKDAGEVVLKAAAQRELRPAVQAASGDLARQLLAGRGKLNGG